MAELPGEQDEQAGVSEVDAWVWGLGWWLACLAMWGMAPVWVPRPVRQACTRRYAGGGRGGRDG